MPFLLLLQVSIGPYSSLAHFTHHKSVPTLRYTRRHLASAVPWISEDRQSLMDNNNEDTNHDPNNRNLAKFAS